MGETDYSRDFMKRTKDIIIEYFGIIEATNREFTLLMNCLLGLIVIIVEKDNMVAFNNKIDADFLQHIPEAVGFIKVEGKNKGDNLIKSIEQIHYGVFHYKELVNYDKSWFLKQIRNCIAHQNIIAVNENGNWTGVRMYNLNVSFLIISYSTKIGTLTNTNKALIILA